MSAPVPAEPQPSTNGQAAVGGFPSTTGSATPRANGESATFSSRTANRASDLPKPEDIPVTWRPLLENKRWVLWAWAQTSKEGKPPKWRKRAADLRGRFTSTSKDAKFFGTYAEISAFWRQYPAGDWQGIGYVPQASDGLVFIDIDNCRDPATGKLTEEAQALVEACGSYAEITPSLKGIRIIGTSTWPTAYARGKYTYKTSGGTAGEVYRSVNFLTVTFNRLPGTTDRLVPINAVVAGLLPAAEKRQPSGRTNGKAPPDAHAPVDVIREVLQQFRNPEWNYDLLRHLGLSVFNATDGTDEGLEAFRAWSAKYSGHSDDTCADIWNSCHGSPPPRVFGFGKILAIAREAAGSTWIDGPLWRRWRKGPAAIGETPFPPAPPARAMMGERTSNETGTPPEGPQPEAASQPDVEDEKERVLAEFNAKYAVVNENGRTVVLAPRQDEMLHRLVYDRMTFTDLRDFYMNRLIKVGSDSKGNPNYLSVAKVWLGHRERRQYNEVVFAPGVEAKPGVLNLWNKFAVPSAPGDWSILREHIRTVLCAGDDTHFNYLIGWMARLLQRPGEQGEVAVVIRGEQGSGKGTLARVLIRILGQHGMAISNAKHLVGSFNAHLRDCVFLFADEAFYAGDKAHIGVLKALITEPYLTVEAKYANAVQMPNYIHLMMAGNAGWVVAADLRERRYFVLNATSEHRNDHPYFARLWEQMENGGYGAMLHDLLALDLRGFNVRQPPATEALEKQKRLSLPVPEQWWADSLHRGCVVNPMGLEEFERWEPFVSTGRLYASYAEFARTRGERHLLSREDLGKFMSRMGAAPSRPRSALQADGQAGVQPTTAPGPRPHGYALGNLDEARAAFVKAIKLNMEWSVEEEPAEEPMPEELAEAFAWTTDGVGDELVAPPSPFPLLARG